MIFLWTYLITKATQPKQLEQLDIFKKEVFWLYIILTNASKSRLSSCVDKNFKQINSTRFRDTNASYTSKSSPSDWYWLVSPKKTFSKAIFLKSWISHFTLYATALNQICTLHFLNSIEDIVTEKQYFCRNNNKLSITLGRLHLIRTA